MPKQPPESGLDESPLATKVSRRSFLSHLGAAGIAAATPPLVAATPAPAAAPDTAACPDECAIPITLKVNGESHKLNLDPRTTLLDALRENLDLPGTKKGCDHGQCGACTVLVNGRRVNSCLTLAATVQGAEITTIEGLGDEANLSPVQKSFYEHDAFQCGYCTPGQICSATALLEEARHGTLSTVSFESGKTTQPTLTDNEIRERMSGNICRCGAYPKIVAAVRALTGAQA